MENKCGDVDVVDAIEYSENVEVSEYVRKINSQTPEGTPETRRRFEIRKKVEDFSDHEVSDLPVFKEPVCLLSTDPEGKLQVEERTLLQLSRLDKQLVVIGIAGLYRTGKSYLMNRLAGKADGFALGSTIQSKTKGVWIWAMEHPTDSDSYLVLLDTEGLGDAEKGNENHDNWIFSLTTLLSSALIYNSIGAIGEESLARLNFVTEISKHIKKKTGDDSEEDVDFDLLSPLFVFALRDFCLDLEIDGEEVTADEYMEHCLNLKTDTNEETKRYNRPRLCVRTYFKKRRCFVFDRPVSKHKMKYLDLCVDSGLNSEFKDAVREFVAYMHKEAPVKRLSTSDAVNGLIFCSLTKTYLDAINNGSVPDTEGAIRSLSLIENPRAVEAAVNLHNKRLHEKLELELPVADDKVLSEVHLECHREALRFFLERAILDNEDSYLNELNERIEKNFSILGEENEEASRQKCRDLLRQLEEGLAQNLRDGVYAVEGGHQCYETDLKIIIQKYQERNDLGNQKDICLVEYQSEKHTESASVLALDKLVTEKEQKAKAELMKALQAQDEQQRAEREKEKLKRMAQERETLLMQTKAEVEQRNAQNLQEKKQHLETVLQQKMQEQARLLQEGHQQNANVLRDQINRLRR